MDDLIFCNGLVYLDGQFVKTNISIKGEKISYIGNEIKEAKNIIDASNLKIIPGIIDPHVHFDLCCGKINSRDDFYYGSQAAIYGGVTTIIDFLEPSRNEIELKQTFGNRLVDAKECLVDYHFHACIKMPNGDLTKYVEECKKLGIKTIKLFTTYSDTNRRTYDDDIIKLLKLSKKYDVMICAHMENDDMINIKPTYTYKDLNISRPSFSETSEALKLANYTKKYNGNMYMVHCSSGETLKQLIDSYSDILSKNFFIESCPQYFVFNSDVLNEENGYLFTFAPPLRSEKERQLLTNNIDYINTIGTDHCAFYSSDKLCPSLIGFPLGVGGIEHSFEILYNLFGDKIIDKMTKNVARIEDLQTKGELKVGKDADIAIFIDKPHTIAKEHGRVDYSIYNGLNSKVEFVHVVRRGTFVLKNRKLIESKGKLINCGEN